eukprot:TRINITY_DN61089_c0_g1_i1.p1 TRINITY_DN61089_c0_g1~~TRINITY_DN61089_c0_g1_i1.p1  ORF type:complete len:351 (+),score=65.22 TRINITY_DN61089_c0_g1_i1:84-1055(+)
MEEVHMTDVSSSASRTCMAHIRQEERLADFFASEKSVVAEKNVTVRIEHIAFDGTPTVLQTAFNLQEGEVLDSGCITSNQLAQLVKEQIEEMKERECGGSIEAPCAKRPKLSMLGSNGGVTYLEALICNPFYEGVSLEDVVFCGTDKDFDISTMNLIPNSDLLTQRLTVSRSHHKTFQAPRDGQIRVVDADTDDALFEHMVETGDVWRGFKTTDATIKRWVTLAVARARTDGWPVFFWLDINRPHDRNIIGKVSAFLSEHDVAGLDFQFLSPRLAYDMALERAKEGFNTISVTSSMLRNCNPNDLLTCTDDQPRQDDPRCVLP